MLIKNQNVMITGAASGMGAATASYFAKHGANVFLVDLNKEAADGLAKKLNGKAFSADVTDEQSMSDVLEQVVNQGELRAVINCAGIVHGRRMVDKNGPMPLSEFKRVIDINLTGTFNVMRLATNVMQAQSLLGEERGIIINTASVAGYEGQIGQTAYAASKAAIIGMTLPAARENARLAIRVVTIAPGIVETPMFDQISEQVRSSLAASVPFPARLAKPEEFAKLALDIVENPMLNGCVIRLDGALRLAPK